MAYNDFRFSLSEDSVNEINSLLEQYAQDIVYIMNGFQDDLIEHMSNANYDKLLKAVDGIIELYNSSVRNDLKNNVFEKWQEACYSMSDFAEKMDMGDESEQLASEIEESLVTVFETEIENRLQEVEVDGRTGASIADFESVNEIFKSVVKNVEEMSDDFESQAERLGEENEFYRFLLPVLIAYSRGICSYFEQAIQNLEILEDNYVSKMIEKKEAIKENRLKPNSEYNFDLSDLCYDGMGDNNFKSPESLTGIDDGKIHTIPENFASLESLLEIIDEFDDKIEINQNKSNEYMCSIAEKMKSDFASQKTEKKPIEEIIQYRDSDDLEAALENLSECKYRKNNMTVIDKTCKDIYDYRKYYLPILEKLEEEIKSVLKNCKPTCKLAIRIYQDVYLARNEKVSGFHFNLYEHAITINNKYMTWNQLNEKEGEILLDDGVLNIKTPVHEYLHYLSFDKGEGTGVKNFVELAKIKEEDGEDKYDKIRTAMTGFNEGITEMFAQDYLRNEIKLNKDEFFNPNYKKHGGDIVRGGSYRFQVKIIREICELLGNDTAVKAAYMNHDFSLIEHAVDEKLKQNNLGEVNWDEMKEHMYNIQSNNNEAKNSYSIITARLEGCIEWIQKQLLKK